jgi:hypothetical protein
MVAISYYKNLLIEKLDNYAEILSALKIAEKYIAREKKIVVGGQAIDYALKIKGDKGIYSSMTNSNKIALPDYDIFSDTHFNDAYDVAEWLIRTNHNGVNVINALHPTTMRVRIYSVPILDITYIPTKLLNIMPTMQYRNFVIIHPHIQMINQHRAISHPYENATYDSVLYRNSKDMERYDLLYKYYPIRILNPFYKYDNTQVNIVLNEINGICFSGALALNWWLLHAKERGFAIENKWLGYIKITNDNIVGELPGNMPITFYSNGDNTHKIIQEYYKLLDYLPEKKILDNGWHMYTSDGRITAHKI